MSATDQALTCYPPRIADAGRRVGQGEWASGHAIVQRLLHCSRTISACPVRQDCACAAENLLCDIRESVAN